MNAITRNEAIVSAFEALGKVRPLSDTESRILQRALSRTSDTRVYRRWTPEDDAALKRMARTRLRAPDIGQRLGRTAWSVRNRIKRLKAERVSDDG